MVEPVSPSACPARRPSRRAAGGRGRRRLVRSGVVDRHRRGRQPRPIAAMGTSVLRARLLSRQQDVPVRRSTRCRRAGRWPSRRHAGRCRGISAQPGFWDRARRRPGRLLRAGWTARGAGGWGDLARPSCCADPAAAGRLRRGGRAGPRRGPRPPRRHSVPKAAILQSYLNSLPYGSGAVGAEAAAITYFQVDAGQLDLAQASLLAASPLRPTGSTRCAACGGEAAPAARAGRHGGSRLVSRSRPTRRTPSRSTWSPGRR